MQLLGLQKRIRSFLAVLLIMSAGLLANLSASAQLRDYLYLPDDDSKRYYLGIGFMYTNSHFQVTPHPQFLQSDSVLSVTPGNSGGFGVSGMFTFRVANHLEFRVAFPEFIFANNTLAYHVNYPPAGETNIATK